jgi:hypothetical protein
MPDDFVMQLTDFENDSDFRPSRAGAASDSGMILPT